MASHSETSSLPCASPSNSSARPVSKYPWQPPASRKGMSLRVWLLPLPSSLTQTTTLLSSKVESPSSMSFSLPRK
jgi:hypothetical protein